MRILRLAVRVDLGKVNEKLSSNHDEKQVKQSSHAACHLQDFLERDQEQQLML